MHAKSNRKGASFYFKKKEKKKKIAAALTLPLPLPLPPLPATKPRSFGPFDTITELKIDNVPLTHSLTQQTRKR